MVSAMSTYLQKLTRNITLSPFGHTFSGNTPSAVHVPIAAGGFGRVLGYKTLIIATVAVERVPTTSIFPLILPFS